jgi:hypothetical protein
MPENKVEGGLTTTRAKLLLEGARITEGARNKSHGNIDKNFQAIADAWNWYIRWRFKYGQPVTLDGADVCELMSLMKKARKLSGDRAMKDHYLDDSTYTAIAFELMDNQQDEPRVGNATEAS